MISDIIKNMGKFAEDNSPAILAGVGVAGVAATAVLAARGATHAERILKAESHRLTEPATYPDLPVPYEFTLKEKVNLTWREYIPAGVIGIGTAAAIIMSTRIGMRRTAAMTAAFSLSEKAFTEYKDKVVEQVGKNKATKVADAVAQDQVSRTPVPGTLVVIEGSDQLCFDSWSARYFKSSMEDLKKAQNDLNHRILMDNYASLSDFYDMLGLEHTQDADDIGWNVDKLLEIEFSTCISPDQRPAISIRYRVEPIRGFHRLS